MAAVASLRKTGAVWTVPLKQRQCPEVIEMGVSQNDPVERIETRGQRKRLRLGPNVFRMHAGIDDDSRAIQVEKETVGADLGPWEQGVENHP